MIEFVTLLLGLAVGPQTLELTADEKTAAVELLLDGAVVARDESAPWELDIELPSGLRPHLLEAVALDADGEELGRTRQRLNVPRPPAEARFTLVSDPEAGRVVAAQLSWESSIRSRPRSTRVWLDGETLAVADPNHIPIPAYDEGSLHLLQAELEFSSDVTAHAQTAFGEHVDQISADLTAFPVTLLRARERTGPEMADWLQTEAPGRVLALEKGGLDLVLVRAPGVSRAIRDLEGGINQELYAGGMASGSSTGGTATGGLASMANTSAATIGERMRRLMAFEGDQRLRILEPRARLQAGQSVMMEVFALSPVITSQMGGLYWSLMQEIVLPGISPRLRLADAVAVAGLQAANGNRRRAVLLVLAGPADDQSRHRSEDVREFLAALQVPLVVWRVGEDGGGWQGWGAAERISDFRDLRNAARQLTKSLESQRIVWLEGSHLPDRVRITREGGRWIAAATDG